ncbi:MAG: hypothetical protein E6J58_23995 [Deltaproteobacteria bacterium]|nr:MAG: hypothetical protein E6J58_23995 [Deltaproteobacteria bacterium]
MRPEEFDERRPVGRTDVVRGRRVDVIPAAEMKARPRRREARNAKPYGDVEPDSLSGYSEFSPTVEAWLRGRIRANQEPYLAGHACIEVECPAASFGREFEQRRGNVACDCIDERGREQRRMCRRRKSAHIEVNVLSLPRRIHEVHRIRTALSRHRAQAQHDITAARLAGLEGTQWIVTAGTAPGVECRRLSCCERPAAEREESPLTIVERKNRACALLWGWRIPSKVLR